MLRRFSQCTEFLCEAEIVCEVSTDTDGTQSRSFRTCVRRVAMAIRSHCSVLRRIRGDSYRLLSIPLQMQPNHRDSFQ
jgi:hypothetical protein